jgi:hypothetical protein
MVKVKLRASKSDVESAESSDFGEPPKPGLYHLKLEGLEQKDNKSGDGKHLVCRWRPVGLGREGSKLTERLGSVWDRVSLTSEEAGWSRARLAIALGGKPNRAGNVDLSLELDSTKPDSPIGSIVLGRVASDTDQAGDYRPKIGSLMPLDATAESEDEPGFDEDDEEEAVADFGDEEEVAAEADDGELLTRADLEEMDNKDLGLLARNDFELNTKQFAKKVKGKTVADREALINAILEAQGGEPEDNDEDDEDDEPF